MVGGDDHDRSIEQPSTIQGSEEPAELVVEIGNAAVVRVRASSRSAGLIPSLSRSHQVFQEAGSRADCGFRPNAAPASGSGERYGWWAS